MTISPSSTGNSPLRMFYIDDSGAEATGWIVYSWIEITPDQWRTGLRHWLDMRKDLYVKYQVPPAAELHATKIANGRTQPSLDDTVNKSKATMRQLMREALAAIQSSSTLQVGTVYRQTTARGKAYNLERQDVYSALVAHLDARLSSAGELGMIFMDGDGSDPGYNAAHRGLKLATRSVIEDALFQHSHASQWMQMADLTAWTTYQHLQQHPGKQWAWPWYGTYLAARDVNASPLQI